MGNHPWLRLTLYVAVGAPACGAVDGRHSVVRPLTAPAHRRLMFIVRTDAQQLQDCSWLLIESYSRNSAIQQRRLPAFPLLSFSGCRDGSSPIKHVGAHSSLWTPTWRGGACQVHSPGVTSRPGPCDGGAPEQPKRPLPRSRAQRSPTPGGPRPTFACQGSRSYRPPSHFLGACLAPFSLRNCCPSQSGSSSS